jgi:hypothetical protein
MDFKRMRRGVCAFFVAGTATVLFASTVFAGNVTETKSDCSEASAVLLGGSGESEPAQHIHGFIEANKVWGDVSVVSWEIAQPWKGGPTTAYGVKCKSGQQCNAFAHAFATAYADSAPVAFCGSTEVLKGESTR